jgi:stage II sporulation protein R
MKQILIFCIFILVGMMILGVLPTHGEADIYDNVVRLHVLASSDSEEDQALKLRVRDAVLEVTTPLLSNCKTQAEAAEILNANRQAIQSAAEAVIAREGYDDTVTLLLDTEEYPARDYDSFCFPAGSYLSLRVCIGEADGQNWWCCLFPPLCLGSSTVSTEDAEDAFISVGLTPSQYKIITESDKVTYRVRFKLLEILEELFGSKEK